MKFNEERENRSRPTNYLARGNQWRLLVLVGSLMLVLVLMDRARDPKNYEWLFRLSQNNPSSANGDATSNGPVEITVPRGDSVAQPAPAAAGGPVSPDRDLHLAEQDAWEFVLQKLDSVAINAVADALMAKRTQVDLDRVRTARLETAVEDIAKYWLEYLQHARRELASSAAADAAKAEPWREVLNRLEQTANTATLSALRSLADPANDVELIRLQSLQAAVDREALTRIVDDTVFHAHDSAAWFRLLELCRSAAPEAAAGTALDVSYLQLLRQPDEYRGRLVRVRGDGRELRWVSVRDNVAGITAYYVLWIKPDDANSPLPVYALQLPPGFPGLAQLQQDGPAVTLTDVPLEIVGYFFKRWAYRAQQSIEVAPLLLAHAPLPIIESPAETGSRLPHPLILVFVAAVISALCVTFIVRRAGQTASHAQSAAANKIPPKHPPGKSGPA